MIHSLPGAANAGAGLSKLAFVARREEDDRDVSSCDAGRHARTECGPENYTAGFLTAGELRGYAADPRTELSNAFLDEALLRGDQCYAIRDGRVLAAYGWYSFGSTPLGLSDLVLNYHPQYVYMYKGFTDTRYRGQRLHAIGMSRALAHYLSSGYKGLVSYVEADNFDSLKSCFRMGYGVFGSIYVTRLCGRYVTFSSPGCKRFLFRLERAPNATEAFA